ncbi:MAG TPA: hypothetical protein VEF72_17280 [Mycobacterium sp.]|nr:hypothetical protein [Mycobacterium sp.]
MPPTITEDDFAFGKEALAQRFSRLLSRTRRRSVAVLKLDEAPSS